eukprot:15334008-Ditylum_brightwellii.AAC.1
MENLFPNHRKPFACFMLACTLQSIYRWWGFHSPILLEALLVPEFIWACASCAKCTTSAACVPCFGTPDLSWHSNNVQDCPQSAL